jgi:hypothetical protein
MILISALFHLSALFSIQLIALTGALFLFIYIGKQSLARWYKLVSVAILGLVLMTMLGTLIGAICMHCHREHREHHEMGMRMHDDDEREMNWGGHHRRMMHMHMEGMPGMPGCPGMDGMNSGHCNEMECCGEMMDCGKGMGSCKEMEGCNEKGCCKDPAHCTNSGDACCDKSKCKQGGEQIERKIIIRKDTIIQKKSIKK